MNDLADEAAEERAAICAADGVVGVALAAAVAHTRASWVCR